MTKRELVNIPTAKAGGLQKYYWKEAARYWLRKTGRRKRLIPWINPEVSAASFWMNKTIIIYQNYGVTGAEKRNVYTYGTPHGNAVCWDQIIVEIPDGWKFYESQTGSGCVETPWGQRYLIGEVLCGNREPHFSAYTTARKKVSIKLNVVASEECRKSAAKLLPEGWQWIDCYDGSGCLQSPEGVDVYSYDILTGEYRHEDGNWSRWKECSESMNLSGFKEFAEKEVLNRLQNGVGKGMEKTIYCVHCNLCYEMDNDAMVIDEVVLNLKLLPGICTEDISVNIVESKDTDNEYSDKFYIISASFRIVGNEGTIREEVENVMGFMGVDDIRISKCCI